MPIQCDLVTQERLVYSGEANYVSLPGIEGVMGILPNHAPLLTALNFGEVIIRHADGEDFYAIGGGFVEIQPDKVVILADTAEQAEEIDLERAETARLRAEQEMAEGVKEDPMRYAQIEASLRRAQIRVDVSSKRSKRQSRRLPDMNNS